MAIAVAGRPPSPPAIALRRYVGAFFNTNSATLRICESDDGLAWVERQGVYVPSTGAVRDPSLLQWNGQWWIAYTGNDLVSSFGVASSPDLATWTPVANPSTASITSVAHTWAPEWWQDPSDSSYAGIHILLSCSASDQLHFTLYEMHPTNAAMTAWSNPSAITYSSKPSWCNDVIDPFIVKSGSTYYLWGKDDSSGGNTGYIGYLTASALTGPYTNIQGGSNWASLGAAKEGPGVLDLGGGHWRLYYSIWGTDGIGYSESTDNLATWSAATAIASLATAGQGTVIKRY